MKKLARTLSSRGSNPKSHPPPHPPSPSSGVNPHHQATRARARTSSLTSPIPPHTHLHFPQCPHTTPPTPRPARLPAVLRTEVVENVVATDTPDASGLGGTAADTDRSRGVVEVRQFLTMPTHCLDCTLALAAQHESWIRELCDGAVREARLRLVELRSGLAAAPAPAPAPAPADANGRDHATDDKKEQIKLQAEIQRHEQRIEEHLRTRDGDVKQVWDRVRKDWEGGVREVVRDDGTGEAEERCVFVMPWETEGEVVDTAAVSVSVQEGIVAQKGSVKVAWIPMGVSESQ
ncbi:hypothetical protein AYO20_01987 [Fonsecaea nubica]|uniref:Uncharacterized protein n=1 Tax=Fonsecaea nubica TaxID=856822 RepID=A0A178DC63_9EURO|nr:hypothetical protein AYO20_01987 [Fonsecaea nubica]OAL38781.1 hypothetical protein AYO20_01987 [Fonsecaea nubica]